MHREIPYEPVGNGENRETSHHELYSMNPRKRPMEVPIKSGKDG